MQSAAEAERDFARHAELARRSDELADAFAHRRAGANAADAGGLQDMHAFHVGLVSLSQATGQGRDQARQSADHHRRHALTANRRRSAAADRISDAERRQRKSRDARLVAEMPQLARVLNNRR